jgi:hypothetical protein
MSFSPDPESSALQQVCAVVYAPRKTRGRFHANVVTVYADEQAAYAASDPEKHLYAARVHGPSVSSEGQRMYYLVRWIR